MASSIDPTKPIVGTPTTASVRDNFAAAKAEIEALQAQVAAMLASYDAPAIITADFPSGSNAGAPPINIWQTRTLNTIIQDGGFLVSLAGNAFTLPPGRYSIRAEFQTYRTHSTLLRLQDLTAGATLDQTINTHVRASYYQGDTLVLESIITLAAESSLSFQQITEYQEATYGWGIGINLGSPERFARVTIRKLPQ